MTFHWTEQDIIAGRWVCRDPDLRPNMGLQMTDSFVSYVYQIGYINGGGEGTYVLISICDGMVGLPMTKAQIADRLNDPQRPMRPCPYQWLGAAIEHLRANRAPL